MFIEINWGSEIPVYEQVVLQIKYAIATGSIRPPELIPSVREMAKLLAINPNTVARSYRILQAESIICACRGTGLAVTEEAPARCQRERIEYFEKRFEQLAAEAVQSGLSVSEIESFFRRTLQKPGSPNKQGSPNKKEEDYEE